MLHSAKLVLNAVKVIQDTEIARNSQAKKHVKIKDVFEENQNQSSKKFTPEPKPRKLVKKVRDYRISGTCNLESIQEIQEMIEESPSDHIKSVKNATKIQKKSGNLPQKNEKQEVSPFPKASARVENKMNSSNST